MSFALINNTQLKELFLNKYLFLKEHYIDEKQRNDLNSLKFKKGAKPVMYNENHTVFLSTFTSVRVCHESDKANYYRNYNIPLGFLEAADSVAVKHVLFKDEEGEFEIDNYFLGIRRALISSFLFMYSGNSQQFQYYFSWFNQRSSLTDLVKMLISVTIATKDYPQIGMSVQFAKSTKQELQFIYLGRLLGEVFFSNSSNKTDEVHRNWLLKLNPANEIAIDEIPERFLEAKEAIVGYILSVKQSQNKNVSINEVLTSFVVIEEAKEMVNTDLILLYFSFFRGLLDLQLNSTFHTDFSSDILEAIEKKAFSLAKDIPIDDVISYEQVQFWEGVQSKKMSIRDKRYNQFCRMVTGLNPEDRTEEDLIKRMQPFNLLSKRALIAFFKSEKSLQRLYDILVELRFITQVLLVYKQREIENKQEGIVAKDILISSIKKKFTDEFPKMKFEIVSKNILDEDDRDVINNLKGFINSYCTEDNFLYISDGVLEPETKREALWIGQAFSPTPLFNKQENYLFV